MSTLSKHLFAALIATILLASCSRPVAYFQPSAREHVAAVSAPATPVSVAALVAETSSTPAEQLAQASVALDQVDAMVRNDNKLSADKTVQKRLNRVRTLLASQVSKVDVSPTEVNTPKKMNLVERIMLKKMNKKISRQLAPANPEKVMVSTSTLATGAVLVIVGLLLLLLTTGTAATIGLIAILVGAVVLLVGLL